jgi:hypothetical protein
MVPPIRYFRAEARSPERESYGIHDLTDGGREITPITEQGLCQALEVCGKPGYQRLLTAPRPPCE